MLQTTDQKNNAQKFVAYLLSQEAQQFLTQQFYEYPLVREIPVSQKQVPLQQLQPPKIDLSQLSDLKRTLGLLQEAGLLY
ncbi:hypothetical protein [Chroococcidiopsis sp [FACHB-1243]]|uniref:hypothetical protein n=1 Tax=Chroococcidiopsis sp. [FACHB-1243] TaxID=2692781 RepID=UPI0018F01587|nr:hypothetical protein [Chroococcidiopsis sp. [FACHB-1243]]